MRTDLDWITTTLINDEASSDEEMTDHFAKEGNMSRKEAEYYVSQRNEALRNPLTFRVRAFESSQPPERKFYARNSEPVPFPKDAEAERLNFVRCPNHHGGGVTHCPRGGSALQIWQRQQWGDR